MRKNHTFIHIILVFLLIFTLSSCGQNSEISSSINPDGTHQDVAGQDVQSDVQNDLVPITHISYADSLSAQAPSDKGIYILQSIFPSSVNVFYIDLATKQEIFLCTTPNCKHNTSDCTSYLPLDEQEYGYSIFYFNDAVYLTQCATNAKRPPHISRMEKDGSSLQDICFLDEGENFTGKLFGYGDNEILIEITHVSVEGQTEKRLERIDCNSGKRNIVVEYPNDSYYGLMAAVNNRLAFIKIDETGYQYFWVTPSSSDISLEECAKTEPIGTLFDDKVMTYTIQSDYLCKVNTESKEISATNLITGQVYEFKYPNNLASATWVGLTHLFDDNFALSVDSESGLTQILLNSETGDLTNEVYSLSKTNNYQIIATIQDQVVCYIRSDERMLANQAEYGLSGETCYIDVFAIASKEEFLQGNVGAEISVPVG